MRNIALFYFIMMLIVQNSFGQLENTDRTGIILKLMNRADKSLENGNTDSTLFYLKDALKLCEKLNDTITLTKIFRKLGQVYEITGDYKSSIRSYYKAISFSQKTKQDIERAYCHLGMSNVNFRTANFELSLNHSLEASEIFNQHKDTSNFIKAAALIAQVYTGLKKYKESLSIYSNLLKMSIKTNDSINIVYNMEHIGGVYAFMNIYDTALIYIEKSLEINNQLNNAVYQGIIYGNIGEIKMRQGKYAEAIKNLQIALDIESKNDFSSGMIFLFYTLGETYSITGFNSLAIENFGKSLDLINKTGELREKPIVFKLMSEHYTRVGNYKKAYEFLFEHQRLSDSLLSLSDLYKLEELKITNELEQAEKAYQDLLNEKNRNEIELKSIRRIIQLQYFVIILIGLGFISSIIFAFYIFRKQRELNIANNEKKLLFSIIGHDLRGPLGNVKQIASLIESSEGSEREAFISMLNQPIDNTLILLDDLLLWAQSNNQDIKLKTEKINVQESVEKIINLLNPLSENKKIRIQSKIPPDIFVHADANHLAAILRNLLSNAIKFTPENGKIEINHSTDTKFLKIEVKDTGVGMDEQTIKKILKLNSFHSTFGTNNEKGSGLGLNICKTFIKKNGGIFGIDSKKGEGSTFYFTVPLISTKH